MLIAIGIIAAVIVVAVMDIAAVALSNEHEVQMEMERPDLISIQGE